MSRRPRGRAGHARLKSATRSLSPEPPALAMCLGYPAAAPGKYLRVRRAVEDFAYRNRFGERPT